MLTVTDLFCGAGGSALGAAAVPGVELRYAANHSRVAVKTHAANFPDVEHTVADISQVNPRRTPRTDILWASPECTNHTKANGRKRVTGQRELFGEAARDAVAERSRATMWDVPRFAEHHRYRAIVVENVVDVAWWELWPAWLHAMSLLGYRHRVLYLNSMHFPAVATVRAPQSRDRLYVVFWHAGQPAPQLGLRPRAWCEVCEVEVPSVQSWKRSDRAPWGRYGAQYVYRCPNRACRHAVVEPRTEAAATAIDWTLPGLPIGSRRSPLAENTMRRIRIGLSRFDGPFIAELRGGGSTARSVRKPMATVATSGAHHLLVEPRASGELKDISTRMLTAVELQAAMGFRPGYTIVGDDEQQKLQIGNAVTPVAAEWLIAAVVESLGGAA